MAGPLPATKKDHSGLRYWMHRVLAECAAAERDFNEEAVHDLRVALRRCRSIADGLLRVDPDPGWRRMKRAGKKLFRRLGELRDAQVLRGCLERLAPGRDPVRAALVERLAEEETSARQAAAAALDSFDRKQWKQWTRALAERARRIPPDGPVAQHLALERWTEAHALHRRALRSRSQAAWHRLRIGLKRFRYTVENFLPRRHAEWGADLKRLQDLLGEAHDLDVLWQRLPQAGAGWDAAARKRWRAWIDAERQARLEEYRRLTTGSGALWAVWRAGLPAGRRLESAALATLAAWAASLDPDFGHARHVARLAVQLYDGLARAGVTGTGWPRARALLHAAALLRDAGKAKGRKGHHKRSYEWIRELAPPMGWTAEEMARVALVARYHRRALPSARHAEFAALTAEEQQQVCLPAGILRLANALDAEHDGAVTHLEVAVAPQTVFVTAHGFREDAASMAALTAERYLLERATGRAVLLRGTGAAAEEDLLEEPAQQALPFADTDSAFVVEMPPRRARTQRARRRRALGG